LFQIQILGAVIDAGMKREWKTFLPVRFDVIPMKENFKFSVFIATAYRETPRIRNYVLSQSQGRRMYRYIGGLMV
jgi:hypothetical protein